MERISTEAKQREHAIAETEYEIVETKQRIEKAREMDERINQLKPRRAGAGAIGIAGGDAGSSWKHSFR